MNLFEVNTSIRKIKNKDMFISIIYLFKLSNIFVSDIHHEAT